MYKNNQNQLSFENFITPFGNRLNASNRWVKLSTLIPWKEIEVSYSNNFSSTQGAPAKSARLAFGSLVIKEKLGLSDEETVEQISENPYLQYFLGFEEFQDKAPFDASMMVHFRKRFKGEEISRINELLVANSKSSKDNPSQDDNDEDNNSGQLIIDASVAPSDITFPTDLKLLNKARELTEEIIDILHKEVASIINKPRTYRKVARKSYLSVAKSKRVSQKKRRQALRKQLNCVERNLKSIDLFISKGANLSALNASLYKKLLVVSEVFRQQKLMYQNKVKRVDDRIVSISQPHIRPIKRGKQPNKTEFGAKLSASSDGKFVFLDKMSLDNYNEAGDLKKQVEKYKKRTGFYPKSVHADKLYRTRDSRNWCKERDIRLSGPPLGRPKKMSKQEKKKALEDENVRNTIEGKFGQAKRRFGLGRIMTKLAGTSLCAISMTFFVINLEKALKIMLSYCHLIIKVALIKKHRLDFTSKLSNIRKWKERKRIAIAY